MKNDYILYMGRIGIYTYISYVTKKEKKIFFSTKSLEKKEKG